MQCLFYFLQILVLAIYHLTISELFLQLYFRFQLVLVQALVLLVALPVPLLPPLPPRVHAFVHACSSEEVIQLAGHTGWISLLLSSGIPVADQVVGACFREAAAVHADGPAFLLRVCKDLAGELAGDLPRLNAILRTVRS